MRDTPLGRSLYLARPFQIKDPACLSCHTTWEMAPPAMVKIYGPANGYGWKAVAEALRLPYTPAEDAIGL